MTFKKNNWMIESIGSAGGFFSCQSQWMISKGKCSKMTQISKVQIALPICIGWLVRGNHGWWRVTWLVVESFTWQSWNLKVHSDQDRKTTTAWHHPSLHRRESNKKDLSYPLHLLYVQECRSAKDDLLAHSYLQTTLTRYDLTMTFPGNIEVWPLSRVSNASWVMTKTTISVAYG